MRTRIKVCGFTEPGELTASCRMGIDAVGFIFVKESSRYINLDEANNMISRVPVFVSKVGVFRDHTIDSVVKIAEHLALDAVQLHGNESRKYCSTLIDLFKKKFCSLKPGIIKAFAVKDEESIKKLKKYRGFVDAYLLDSCKDGYSGGTGEVFDWDLAKLAKRLNLGPIILAGGLKPSNVYSAVMSVRPYAVDVCSKVEEKSGRKDLKKIKSFIDEVNKTDEKFDLHA